jgi:putative Ca2+/H+ antiporter (TMEM165/GDT1 family)
LLSPHPSGSVFGLTAAVFLFVFIAGIVADLLETRSLESVAAIFVGLVAANAIWDLTALVRLGH